MKANRFDDIIKNKVDNIHYSASDAEVDAIHKSIISKSKITLDKKIYALKPAFIMTLLVASIYTNIYLWRNSSATVLPISNYNSPEISTNVLIAANAQKNTQNNSNVKIDKNLPVNKDLAEATLNAISYENNFITPKKHLKKPQNLSSQSESKPFTSKVQAIENNISHAESHGEYRLGHFKDEALMTSFVKATTENTAQTLSLLSIEFQPLQSSNHQIPIIDLDVTANKIIPILVNALPLPKFELGLNSELNTTNINFGLIGRYNINRSISIVASANKYLGRTRNYINKNDSVGQLNEILDEKYDHDFSGYTSVVNLNEQVRGYAFSCGANYKLNLWHDFNINAGASSTFNLTSTSNLTFDYQRPPAIIYHRLGLNVDERKFKFSHITANLGLGKRLGRFDFNLLFNANFTKTNNRRHYEELGFSPGVTSRILYGF